MLPRIPLPRDSCIRRGVRELVRPNDTLEFERNPLPDKPANQRVYFRMFITRGHAGDCQRATCRLICHFQECIEGGGTSFDRFVARQKLLHDVSTECLVEPISIRSVQPEVRVAKWRGEV